MAINLHYAECVYDEQEISAVNDILLNQRFALMDGPAVREFESIFPEVFQKKYGLMVNSGSSANLLALASLDLPKGGEVITPALTFSTTVAPIVQLGLKPVFIDVDPNTLQADLQQLKTSLSERTCAVMLPNLIGNVVDWKKVREIVDEFNSSIFLVEDSADTVGYSINGQQGNPYSDITTTSFYASHIITGAGFGGFVAINNPDIYGRAKLLRGWGRRSAIFGESESVEDRFGVEVDGIAYDAKYIFDEFGYNFLPSDISAAFAKVQLEKLEDNISTRVRNFSKLKAFLQNEFPNSVAVFNEYPGVRTPWLAFPIVLNSKKITRTEFQIAMESRGVQTRTIFTGNILRQPVSNKYGMANSNDFSVADNVMKNGVLLGCHHGLSADDVEVLCGEIKSVLNEYDVLD